MHIRLWAGMSVNTGKMRKYTSNFEFAGGEFEFLSLSGLI